MNNFTYNFNHGFFHGMFNRMFGGFGTFNWGCLNFTPSFFTPNFSFGNFFNYQSPMPMAPSVFNYNVPNFSAVNANFSLQNYSYAVPANMNMNWQGFDCSTNYTMPNFLNTECIGDSFVRSTRNPSHSSIDKKHFTPARMTNKSINDKYFDTMLNYLLSREGGYVNDPNDSGGETNRGVTKNTYDAYRRRKELPTRNVREITDAEIREIYHEFFVKSGADRIDNPRMALMVFEVATGSGCAKAKELFKKSGGSLEKMEQLRREWYADIVRRRPKNKKFLKGWNNRLTATVKFAKENLPERSSA